MSSIGKTYPYWIEDNGQCRQIRESIAIKLHQDTVMNRDEGSYDIGQAWDSVISSIKLEGRGGGVFGGLVVIAGMHFTVLP